MIDIHSHILYGIDDGAPDIDESIAIIRNLRKLGFDKIIATPHYIDNTDYVTGNKVKKEILNKLKKGLKISEIDVEVYLGNEIYLSEDILEKIDKKQISKMNDSKYLLIELPLSEKFEHSLDMLTNIKCKGYYIILAHPERYKIFQENPEKIEDYLDAGILLQGNLASLDGRYGRKAKKLFKQLLKKRNFFALASDSHRSTSKFFTNFEKLKKKAIKLTDEEYFHKLFNENPEKVLKNEKQIHF